ncbi:hypothetical protein [Sphingomonas sp. SRS2]|uniref:hypothetical protein n=1 Tax=Sphingomonas sp. SRS2 TaxID=133190 RepID=UPI000697EC0C|nr:hypothetical protein [Sphingomonas sp. SRS2]
MGFTAKHTVHHNGTESVEGKPVKFTDAEMAEYRKDQTGPIADLLERGAIEGALDKEGGAKAGGGKAADKPTAAASADEAGEKPLAEMLPMQLGALAKKLGIPKEPKLVGEDLIAAIEAKRAEIAAAAAPASAE